MNFWIFQGNPDVFDIDTYLVRNTEISWSVRQKHFAEVMAPGDQVFLWRASGSAKGKSGIVARGIIKSFPAMMNAHRGQLIKPLLRYPAQLHDPEFRYIFGAELKKTHTYTVSCNYGMERRGEVSYWK